MSTSFAKFNKSIAMFRLSALAPATVIPAKAGIQLSTSSLVAKLDSCLRRNDGIRGSVQKMVFGVNNAKATA
jgi:hypothetical protein